MIEFEYNKVWWAENAGTFVMLWDVYGFFTHISTTMFFDEVLNKLPDNYTNVDLDKRVQRFFRKYDHLYCCMN